MATTAPGQPNGPGAGPPICGNCGTSTTPLWRRDDDGNVLCNACGLFLKLHAKARPVSLKTDMIKSRNRVKAAGHGGAQRTGLPAAHPSTSQTSGFTQPGTNSYAVDQVNQMHSPSAYSQSVVGHTQSHVGNIAPQHMFDNTTLDGTPVPNFANMYTHDSPDISQQNQPSASSSELQDTALSNEELRNQNNNLRTRVSELEFVNNLYRDRVSQLEREEQSRKQMVSKLQARQQELEAKLYQVEASQDGDIPRKRSRMEDEGDGLELDLARAAAEHASTVGNFADESSHSQADDK